MSDLISRLDAIDTLSEAYWDKNIQSAKDDPCIVDAMTDWAIRQMKSLLSVQPEPKWIPCSERLPEDYEDVLVWFEYFRYGSYNRLYQTHGIGDYSSEYDSWIINHQTGWHQLRVIAWMPLPDPPKGEQNE